MRFAMASLENAEDYKDFEAAITADYDAQSAVERELVLRLASILWRLRRATTIETGLFGIHADGREFGRTNRLQQHGSEISPSILLPSIADCTGQISPRSINGREVIPYSTREPDDPCIDMARSFLRLASMPACQFDRLSRYEAVLWRQAGQLLFALDVLDRRNPQERGRRRVATRPVLLPRRFGV